MAKAKVDGASKQLAAQGRTVTRAEQAHKRALARVESLQARRDRHLEQAKHTEEALTQAREAAALAQSSVELEKQHHASLEDYVNRRKAGEANIAEGYVEPAPGQEPTQTAS